MEEFAAALEALSESNLAPASAPAPLRPSTRAPVSSRRKILGGVLVIGVAVGLWSLWQWSQPSTADFTDELSAGSIWAGRFRFVGMNYEGTVQMTVEERADDEFYGIYETENGAYAWAIRGTLHGENIRWEFTDVVQEKEPRSLVGLAYVEGTCRGPQMDVMFRHPGYNSRAEMTLKRVK
jgi:hypothetical protein